jgi:5-methylcytosine-specific restriction protein A
MIREVLEKVARGYLPATNEPFRDNALAGYLRKDAAEAISNALQNSYYVCKGSPGQGVWADVPWIGIFDPTVTSSATCGYYVVYLFAADMQKIYLVLGQGTTAVREEFKTNTRAALIRYAGIMRDRLPEAKARFSGDPISLNGTSTLARDYEPTIALSATYDLTSFLLKRSSAMICERWSGCTRCS